jgi:hypothetical protein
MYDELIAALRGPYDSRTDILLMKQAADAIEELQGRARVLEKLADKWCEAVPKWIPVTERLPEKINYYLVHVKCECDGKLVSAWKQIGWFCEKFYWEHLHGDDVFKETVTHWMPLPEPPKEET